MSHLTWCPLRTPEIPKAYRNQALGVRFHEILQFIFFALAFALSRFAFAPRQLDKRMSRQDCNNLRAGPEININFQKQQLVSRTDCVLDWTMDIDGAQQPAKRDETKLKISRDSDKNNRRGPATPWPTGCPHFLRTI